MILNSSYKKVRSISEGNFHSCYASNKAEKFKFSRLSQGLESCAQAQALKFRKEEKELLRLYQNMEREKERNAYERRHNQSYLKMKDSKELTHHTETKRSLHSKASKNLSLQALQRNSKSLHNPDQDSKKDPHHKKNRRSSLPVKLDTTSVVPFYMQNSYTHYHFDPYYDQMLKSENSSDHFSEPGTAGRPCWQKDTKLSRLKYRRDAITTVNSEHKEFLRSLEMNTGKQNPSSVTSMRSEKSADGECSLLGDSSMHVNYFPPGSLSSRILPDIPTKSVDTQQHQSSVLTPMERQELAKYQHRNLRNVNTPTMEESERKTKHLFEHSHHHGRRHTLPVVNTSKLNLLKRVLLKEVANGENLKNLSHDERFESVLDLLDDGRVYPAYHENVDYTFEDFCALRKCKYLRVSKLNQESLTEATLATLLSMEGR